MAGSGVDAKVIKAVGAYIGAPAFHMSGKVTLDSAMIYRKEGVNMGLPSISEFELWRTQRARSGKHARCWMRWVRHKKKERGEYNERIFREKSFPHRRNL